MFLRRQMWVPNIENKDRAGLVAIVPRLMLNGVIERKRGSYLPRSRLATDAEPTPIRNDQRNVND